jgi:hypothetical protein
VSTLPIERLFERLFANHFINRMGHKTLFAVAMLLCILWSGAAALRTPAVAAPVASTIEWPREWEGAALRPLALSEVEQRFADRFPGAIGRMTDGRQTLVMREVREPTRMLHPAADCYRALGYRIAQERLEHQVQAGESHLWRCFVAQRHGGQKLRVCERIVDADGAAFTDTSAWYWAAASGRSNGPWQAVTVARPM